MMDDVVREISISRTVSSHALWWLEIWWTKDFNSWADARGWLWDDYRAEVFNTRDGFRIQFLYDDDATLFRLTWLYSHA